MLCRLNRRIVDQTTCLFKIDANQPVFVVCAVCCKCLIKSAMTKIMNHQLYIQALI